MHLMERILLYGIAIGFGLLLLFDPQQVDLSSLRSLSLTDSSGKARIDLFTERAGNAGIAFFQPDGKVVASLLTNENGESFFTLSNPKGSELQLQSQEDGTVEVVVAASTEIRAVLSATPDGQLAVDLQGAKGASSRMVVAADGQTEIGVGTGGAEPVLAFLRTGTDDVAEIAIRARDGQSGTSMTVLPTGDMGIVAKGPDGAVGPMLQLSKNGLGQVAVTGPDASSGPSLLRFPDGTASIQVKGEGASFGPSMILLPDGSSQTAVTAKKGRGQAILSVSAEGAAKIAVLGQQGETLETLPKEK